MLNMRFKGILFTTFISCIMLFFSCSLQPSNDNTTSTGSSSSSLPVDLSSSSSANSSSSSLSSTSSSSSSSSSADVTPPTAGTGITFSGTTATGTTVNWGAASDNLTAQAGLQYKVVKASTSTAINTVSKVDAITGPDLVMDWTSNTISKAVTGLTDGTTYYFAVIVKDTAGNMSLYSPQYVITTDTTAPTTGTGITFSGTTATGTTVNWGAASDNCTGQVSLQYKVVKASTSTAINTVSKVDAISGPDLVMDWTSNTISKAVTGLTSSTTYYFAVIVKDTAGNKSLYSPQYVTTSAAAATPVTQYKFENNGNDTAGSYNLTAHGSPTYSSSTKKEGSYSVSISGSGCYLDTTNASISVSSGISVSLWVYPTSVSSGPTILTLQDSSGKLYCLYFCSTTTLELDGATSLSQATYSSSFFNSTWYHLVFTVDASRNLTLYVNGSALTLETSGGFTTTVDTYLTTITKVEVASYNGATSYPYTGNIDDVRIYNKVLNASEVSALYATY